MNYLVKQNSKPVVRSDASTWYIIVNPVAGNGAVQKLMPRIKELLLSEGIEFELAETEYKRHAIDLSKAAIERGFSKIIAVGGDGTNNEVVNGIFLQNTLALSEITYTLLPIGTGNDWIKEHLIPRNLLLWAEMLKEGYTRSQDVGLVSFHNNGIVEKRYFVNVAGMAYDPFVLAEMEKIKRPLNRIAYLFYSLISIFKYKLQSARIRFNDRLIEDEFYLINVGICRYSGGGMQLVPHARPDDGQLALTLAGKLSKMGVILNSYRFYNGKIANHSKVDTFHTESITVEALDDPIALEVDGEIIGETPVEFKILPGALRIIVPEH